MIWVTSAYLLAYAVPLLVTGRLGDRFGPKNLYLIGLVRLHRWPRCGAASPARIEMLIAARVVQGLGAALMTPQTMAVITRIFPPDRRGAAMGLWGATAGVATLVGPILGGVLVDGLGWEWIFFVNVPVGIVGFVLAVALRAGAADPHPQFDILGVVLSAVGLFLLVFGIQEGETYNWGTIAGPDLRLGPDHRRHRRAGRLRRLAGRQQGRAAGAAAPVQGPQLLAGQHRDHHRGLHASPP